VLTSVERGPEIAGAKARLEALSGERVRDFGIPYAVERDAPPSIMAATRDAGYEAVFSFMPAATRSERRRTRGIGSHSLPAP